MMKKVANYYKKTVTKDELLHYLGCYGFIEIIPIKDGGPIFILKNLPYHHTLSEKYPRNLIIHKEKFVLPTKKIDIWKNWDKKGFIALSPTDTDTTYLDKYKKVYSSKTFSIHSIFDKEIRVRGKKYIKPIRNLLRKYHIIRQVWGKKKRKHPMAKKRYDFVVKEYKKIGKGRKMFGKIQQIYNKWMEEVSSMGQGEKYHKYFYGYTTIRRDIERYKKAAIRH